MFSLVEASYVACLEMVESLLAKRRGVSQHRLPCIPRATPCMSLCPCVVCGRSFEVCMFVVGRVSDCCAHFFVSILKLASTPVTSRIPLLQHYPTLMSRTTLPSWRKNCADLVRSTVVAVPLTYRYAPTLNAPTPTATGTTARTATTCCCHMYFNM